MAATAKNPCGVHTILEPLIEVEIDGQTYQTVPFYGMSAQYNSSGINEKRIGRFV